MRERLLAGLPEGAILVSTAAGCGAALRERDERVLDLSEALVRAPSPPTGSGGGPVAVFDACHLLHAQQVREAPRELLRGAGYEPVELAGAGRCCGAAGVYAFTQPELSRQLATSRVEAIEASGAPRRQLRQPGLRAAAARGAARGATRRARGAPRGARRRGDRSPDVTQLLPVGLLAAFTPGFLLARHHHPHAVARDRLWRVMYWLALFTLPVLLASAPIRKAGPAVLASTGCLLLVVAAASAYGRWRFRTSAERTAFTLSAFWPNTGWLGLPVCAALLGPSSLPTAALYASLASGPHNMLVGGSLAAAHAHRGLAAVRAAVLGNRLLFPVLLGLAWAASGVGTFGLGNPARWVALASAFPAFVALGLTLGSLNLRARPRRRGRARAAPRPLSRAPARRVARDPRAGGVPDSGRDGDRAQHAHHVGRARTAAGPHRPLRGLEHRPGARRDVRGGRG